MSKYNKGRKYSTETLVLKTSIINNKHTWKDAVVKSYKLQLKITKKIHDFPTQQHLFLKTVKGKSVPLQAWSGPEGSRKLRFPDFMTMAQGGGKVVSLMHRPHLPTGNSPGTHFC